jgi:hypothetical protein
MHHLSEHVTSLAVNMWYITWVNMWRITVSEHVMHHLSEHVTSLEPNPRTAPTNCATASLGKEDSVTATGNYRKQANHVRHDSDATYQFYRCVSRSLNDRNYKSAQGFVFIPVRRSGEMAASSDARATSAVPPTKGAGDAVTDSTVRYQSHMACNRTSTQDTALITQ